MAQIQPRDEWKGESEPLVCIYFDSSVYHPCLSKNSLYLTFHGIDSPAKAILIF